MPDSGMAHRVQYKEASTECAAKVAFAELPDFKGVSIPCAGRIPGKSKRHTMKNAQDLARIKKIETQR